MQYSSLLTDWRRGSLRYRVTRDRLPDALTVKDRITPWDFYAHELPGMPAPKRSTGWVDGGLCAFHDDRKRGSFRVNLTTGAYKCFSCDAKGGDIISFTMQQYGLSFRDALEHLARTWGIRS
jgi:hypothetical protein